MKTTERAKAVVAPLRGPTTIDPSNAEPVGVEIAGRTYLKPGQLADILGISIRTLARWDEARVGPPRIKVGQLVLYDAMKFTAWLAGNETSPVALGDRASRARGRAS